MSRLAPTETTHPDHEGVAFATRLRTTAVMVVAIALLVVGAAALTAQAAAPGSATDAESAAETNPMPLPPDAGEMVGVLDLFGRPVLGPDGQTLAIPLRPPTPRLPANADEVLPPGGDPAVPEVVEVDIFTAHARTLNEVATDEQYTLVQRFDLFAANGLLSPAEGSTGGLAAYRNLLSTLDQQVAAGQTSAACATASAARGQSDGVPSDLIAGPSRAPLHDEVAGTGEVLGCPA
jgi:hypothetical protein